MYIFTTVYILSASDSARSVCGNTEFIDLLYVYICIDYICIIHDHNPPCRLKILTVHSMYNVIVILMVALFVTWVKGDTNFVEQRSSQVDLFDRLRDESRCCSSYDFVKKRRKFIFEFVESNCSDKSLNVCRLNKVNRE